MYIVPNNVGCLKNMFDPFEWDFKVNHCLHFLPNYHNHLTKFL